MFSHSSNFKKFIALSTTMALLSVTFVPLAHVFAEGEEGTPAPAPETNAVPPEETSSQSDTPESSPVETTSEETVEETSTEPVTTEEVVEQEVQPEVLSTETEETASSTEPVIEPLVVNASTTQEVLVENEATSTSDTGNNVASSTHATTTVVTGDAVATANVITAVNVSVYNSSGLLLFLTNLLGGVGTIDFRDLGFLAPPRGGQASSTPCSFVGCDSGLFTNITTNQDATVNTSVSVGANTGGNTSSGGDASISTGNAVAAANVVTVANSTFIDSNYLMVVFNQFGSWGEDVVFPGAETFGSLFGGSSHGSGSVSVTTNNNADIENEVSVVADTGGNMASSTDGSATITSGDATAGATVVNTVNTSLVDSNAFVVIFRIHGNWTGSLFGLPSGVSWARTGDGIALYSSPEGSPGTMGGSLSSSSTQNATIKNAVEVYALTGNNRATGEGDASVETGDATAAANIVTIANSQVIGRNWLFAIVNIFGDWGGNIAFGRPDLWVGGSADLPQNPARERDVIRYTFALKNNGDAEAHNSLLSVALPPTLEFLSVDGGGSYATGTVSWQLGSLSPRSSRTVSFTASVNDRIGYGTQAISVEPVITSDEPDQNSGDNRDNIAIDTFRPGPAPVSYYIAPAVSMTPIPAISITKSVLTPTATASSSVSYRISLTNEAEGPAYQAILFDTLRGPDGKILFEKTWDIGDIAPHETVTVDYQVFFVGDSTPGLYTNEAYLKGLGGTPWSESYKGYYITSRTATATLMLSALPTPLPLEGASSSLSATSTPLGGTIDHGRSLLFAPYSAGDGGYGQLAGLAFAADSRRLLALFPLFLACILAAYYLTKNSSLTIATRRELVLDFLRSHHLFFW